MGSKPVEEIEKKMRTNERVMRKKPEKIQRQKCYKWKENT